MASGDQTEPDEDADEKGQEVAAKLKSLMTLAQRDNSDRTCHRY